MHRCRWHVRRPCEGRVLPLLELNLSGFLVVTLIRDVVLIVTKFQEGVPLGYESVHNLRSLCGVATFKSLSLGN